MRVIGLLSWYEESPGWLVECVASAARLCDHIIAVDGPYAAFPGALRKPFSGTEQSDAIMRTAAGAGIGCTIHAPRQPWWDGEVGKRDFMFRVGEAFTTRVDWYLRIDADEVLTNIPDGTKSLLAQSDADVAEVMLWEREPSADMDFQTPFRCLFRALPGIRIEQAHYVVTAFDGGRRKVLRGNEAVHRQEPAMPLWDVRLEHRTGRRPVGRQRLKRTYGEAIPQLEPVRPFDDEEIML